MPEPQHPSPHSSPPPPRSWSQRVLDCIEWAGNKLPDPAVLFVIALLLTWLISALLAPVAFSDIDPRTIGTGKVPQTIAIKNQLTGEALTLFLSRMVKTFTEFPPLGVVLVAMLGVGIAEHTGFLNAGLKGLLSFTPGRLLTPMVLVGFDPKPHGRRYRLRAGDPARWRDLPCRRTPSAGGHRRRVRRRLRRV